MIPNDFEQREQQRLLDACNAAGIDASLIWLPVAAILAWLEDCRDSLPIAGSLPEKGLSVLVVHADWGHIRCPTLNLVAKAEFGCRWIPARRRPKVNDYKIPGFWMAHH